LYCARIATGAATHVGLAKPPAGFFSQQNSRAVHR
jgi:hypothetical protein